MIKVEQRILKKKFKLKNNKFKNIFICFLTLICYSALAEDYKFNANFIVGGDSVDLNKLNNPEIVPAGKYDMSISINGKYVGDSDLKIENENNINIICVNDRLISLLNLKKNINFKENSNQCISLNKINKDIKYNINISDFKLRIELPQAYINSNVNSIDSTLWDDGIAAGFVNYNINYYNTRQSGYTSSNFFTMLNSGFNLGLWHFRNNSNFYINNNSKNNKKQWNNINSYVERPISELKSNLIIGDYYSNSTFFDSVKFRGLSLFYDKTMLPYNQRGFAPVIRGVANSNSTVKVTKDGVLLYSTSVPTGPFEINDRLPNSSGGTLDVTVTGADGNIQTYSVSNSSIANLLRPGSYDYNLSIGELYSDKINSNPKFLQFDYSLGLSNLLTGYLGGQLSKNYKSVVTGVAVNSNLGAFNFSATQSYSELDKEKINGTKLTLSYDKYIESINTSVFLSFDKFTNKDYLNFYQTTMKNESKHISSDNLKTKFQLHINQPIFNNGNLFISGSTEEDWYDRRTTYYEAGYSSNYKNISYSVNLSRVMNNYEKTENQLSLSINIPFPSQTFSNNSISVSYNTSSSGVNSSTIGINGYGNNNLSYSISDTYTKNNNSLSGLLTKDYSQGTTNISVGLSDNYKQYSVGFTGSMIVHSGGITLGKYLSTTPVLVEAKDAKGAKIDNVPGVYIDRFGYAIVPYVTPYMSNKISINPEGMPKTTELIGSEKIIIPYKGSIGKIKFKTRSGYKAFIYTNTNNNDKLPIGATVKDEHNFEVGVIGQNNIIYATGLNKDGVLSVKWGGDVKSSCKIQYNLSLDEDVEFYTLKIPCE